MKTKQSPTSLVLQYLARRNSSRSDSLSPCSDSAAEIDGTDVMDVQRRYLDPQPLPPRSGGRNRSSAAEDADHAVTAFQIGTAAAQHYLQVLSLADSLSLDSSLAQRLIDDYCGTQPPVIKIKWKWPGPPEPGPRPEELAEFYLGLFNAIAIVSFNDKTLDGNLNRAMDKIAMKVEASVQALSARSVAET